MFFPEDDENSTDNYESSDETIKSLNETENIRVLKKQKNLSNVNETDLSQGG